MLRIHDILVWIRIRISDAALNSDADPDPVFQTNATPRGSGIRNNAQNTTRVLFHLEVGSRSLVWYSIQYMSNPNAYGTVVIK